MDVTKKFELAMFDIYRRADGELGYRPTVFLHMLHEKGAVPTARSLINAPRPSDGYTRLYEKGRLDLTVEAVVVESQEFHSLFAVDEIAKARRRLFDFRYKFKDTV